MKCVNQIRAKFLFKSGILVFFFVLLVSMAIAEGTSGEGVTSNFNGVLGILFAYLAGVAISLTPCVWPMYPITSSVIINSSDPNNKKSAFFLSMTYLLGLSITYTILGAITGAVGEAVSIFLKELWVVLIVSVVLVIFGLSMLGLFEIRMPSFVGSKFSSGKKKGVPGVLFMGLVSGVVLSPCITPALGALVAFVIKSGSWFVGAYMFFAFALGVGTLLVIIGTFSGALKALPKPGQWMVWVKRSFGIIIILLAFWLALPTLQNALQSHKTKEEQVQVQGNGILWTYDLEKGLKENKVQGKPVMIDFFAEWCKYCKLLDKTTFTDSAVIKESQRFTAIKFDVTQPTAEIRKTLKKYDIKGFPTIIFIDSKGHIKPLVGYADSENFLKYMKQIK